MSGLQWVFGSVAVICAVVLFVALVDLHRNREEEGE